MSNPPRAPDAEWIPRTHQRFREEDVPLEPQLGSLGKKWALVILRRVAVARRSSFAQLLRIDRRLSRRILSLRLRELLRAGYLTKTATATGPYRHEYRLTEKGRYALPFLLAYSDLIRRYGRELPVAPALRAEAVDPVPRASPRPVGWPEPSVPGWDSPMRSSSSVPGAAARLTGRRSAGAERPSMRPPGVPPPARRTEVFSDAE